MTLRTIGLAITLLLATSNVLAQYASVADLAAQEADEKKAKLRDARNSLIDTEFWVVPNPKAITRLKFQEDTASYSKQAFVLTDKTSFKVVGFEQGQYTTNYVQVEFPDGKRAYLKEGHMFDYDYKKTSLFADVASRGKKCYDFQECVLAESPEQLLAAENKSRAKSAAAAKAWKARGGVAIGMTASQVRASNWGKPQTINRSSGSYGTHEQWVYGDNNYVYLQNGVVTSIQN